MIVVERAPCAIKSFAVKATDGAPILEIKLSLPDVDPACLVGVWPDIEQFCVTSEAFEVRSKQDERLMVQLRNADDAVVLDATVGIAGVVSYERSLGTGSLSLTLALECPDQDPRPILSAIWAFMEPEPSPQGDLFA